MADEDVQVSFRRFTGNRTSTLLERRPISHECLREHPFFSGRDPGFVDILIGHTKMEVIMKGQDIITEGEMGKTMYFLYRGSVAVLIGPEEKQVATLKEGSIFGELALLGNGHRTSTVRALEVCDCRVIDAKTFNVALRRFPEERQYFHEMATERIKALPVANVSLRNAAQTALASVKLKHSSTAHGDALELPTGLDAKRHAGSMSRRFASMLGTPLYDEDSPHLPSIYRSPPKYADRDWDRPHPLLANPMLVLKQPKRHVSGIDTKLPDLGNSASSFKKQWPGGLMDWVQKAPPQKIASLQKGLDDLQLEAPSLRAAIRAVEPQRTR